MRHLTFFTLIIVFLSFNSCTTNSKISNYDLNAKKSIRKWFITFTYEVGGTEEKTTSDGKKEKTIIKGQYAKNLQLLDDIYYRLKNKKFPISKKDNKNRGVIKMNPLSHEIMSAYSTMFKSIDVTIYDSKENLIHRVKIENNPTGCFPYLSPKSDESFAHYTADLLYKLLTKKNN